MDRAAPSAGGVGRRVAHASTGAAAASAEIAPGCSISTRSSPRLGGGRGGLADRRAAAAAASGRSGTSAGGGAGSAGAWAPPKSRPRRVEQRGRRLGRGNDVQRHRSPRCRGEVRGRGGEEHRARASRMARLNGRVGCDYGNRCGVSSRCGARPLCWLRHVFRSLLPAGGAGTAPCATPEVGSGISSADFMRARILSAINAVPGSGSRHRRCAGDDRHISRLSARRATRGHARCGAKVHAAGDRRAPAPTPTPARRCRGAPRLRASVPSLHRRPAPR